MYDPAGEGIPTARCRPMVTGHRQGRVVKAKGLHFAQSLEGHWKGV